MSMELYDEKEVKARTEHICVYCGGKINKGDTCRLEKGKFYGEFFSRHCCSLCMPHTAYFWDAVDNESGDIREDFCEFCASCPQTTKGYWPKTFGSVPERWNGEEVEA